MKTVKIHKEKPKLILLIGITVIFFLLGYFIFDNTHYSSALLGVSAASLGLSLFQLKRIFNFTKNPESYNKEQINIKDERNVILIGNAKASAYDIETFAILGITAYAIYLDNIGFALTIFALWIIRIFSFIYYYSKNSKQY
ncbi:hypothetical protein QUV80_02090 [Paraclostridium benzoelyticum]|nr:hypothetical protein [Paraclostridium benzoelyticum]